MELQGEDGSVVALLPESAHREFGRGPGFAPRDRTVSRRQVRLKLQQSNTVDENASSRGSGGNPEYVLSVEVIGPNPICCVIDSTGSRSRSSGGEKEKVVIVETGKKRCLERGDRLSLSIHTPVFYTLQTQVARADPASGLSGGVGNDREAQGNAGGGNGTHNGEEGASEAASQRSVGGGGGGGGDEAGGSGARPGAADEEEGIAKAVARWQRRRQERMELQHQRLQEGSAIATGLTQERKDSRTDGDCVAQLGDEEAPELDPDPSLAALQETNLDNIDPVRRFGFLVEGSEFEQYSKKQLDPGEWEWQIGKRRVNNDEDDDEDGDGEESREQAGIWRKGIAAGSKANKKAGHAKKDAADDDDEWEGDSEGERELLTGGKKRKTKLQPRSRDSLSASDPVAGKRDRRDKFDSTPGNDLVDGGGKTEASRGARCGQVTASTTGRRTVKRKTRADDEEEEEIDDDDDEGGDLDGFLVDDANEEEDKEVGEEEEEEEWIDDEDEGEDDNGTDEMDVGSDRPISAPTTRSAKEKRDTSVDAKPMCKYGSACFRKNKDHLAQFQH